MLLGTFPEAFSQVTISQVVNFPNVQFPKQQLPKGYVRSSKAPQAAMGAERWGYDGKDRAMRQEQSAGGRALGLGHSWEVTTWENTLGKLPLGKNPLRTYLTSLKLRQKYLYKIIKSEIIFCVAGKRIEHTERM